MKKQTFVKSLIFVINSLFIINAAFAGLEGYWDFNESLSSQTYDDSSPNNYDLTRGSTLSSDANDPSFSSDTPHHTSSSDYSADFDGINDYAWITNYSQLKPATAFTLSTWVKFDSLDFGSPGSTDAQDVMISNIGAYNASGGYQLLFADATNPCVAFMYRPKVGSSYPDRGISYSLTDLGWQTDTWYHVAATYTQSGSNAILKLYLDGKLVTSNTLSGIISYDNTPKFYLGTNYDGVGNLNTNERELDGHLDETRVYSDAKSDSYIRETLAAIDIEWASAVSDSASNKSRWFVQKIPGYSANAILPNYGTPYTVTLDANWEIDDLHVEQNAKAYLGNYNLTVHDGGNINGTLELAGSTYSGSSNISTGSNSLVIGYGTINPSFSNNQGTIKAQGTGQQLSIDLEGNDSEGTLSADLGATLYIRNAHDIANRETISLTGGTLKGNSGIYNLINAAEGDSISGYGIIDDFRVNIGPGSLTASGNGKTLTFNEGFTNSQATGTINIESGATLNIPLAWTNYATINMTGGSITGNTMGQGNGNTGLNILSGINNIQNINFFSGSKNTISNSATLNITGTGTLSGATISASGLGGTFKVDAGATVQGYGTIYPDVIDNGSLIANASGYALTVNGTLNVGSGRSAYSSNAATLTAVNTVTNQGNIYANSNSIVNINNTLTNSGNVYSNGGTVNLSSSIFNRSNIYVNSGTMNISGSIKAGTSETGEFYVNSGQMNISATIESGSRNIFTANSSGTITMPDGFSTGLLYLSDGLRPRGGLITLNNNQTLTNDSGKSIKGYGTLLNSSCSLTNFGNIEGDTGILNIFGNILNNGNIFANGFSDSVNIQNRLEIGSSGSVYASTGGRVNISDILTNNGSVYTSGANSEIFVSDTNPTGNGTFTAYGGTIYFTENFSNETLARDNALQVAGGRITVGKGTMTNAYNKTISGYGYLLGGAGLEKTIQNYGTIETRNGNLVIEGNVINFGSVNAYGTDILQINSVFTNNTGGLISSNNGASISIGTLINNGTVEISNGNGSGSIYLGQASGNGNYSIENGILKFTNLSMSDKSYINDNNTNSIVEIHGNVSKEQGSQSSFDMDNIRMSIFNPHSISPDKHNINWEAQDMGIDVKGLIDNLAVGQLIFGDNLGNPGSDLFLFDPNSIIYCYGLGIMSDADIDLQGSTIYYLRDGDEVNGIIGTGFKNSGVYYNGKILEISVSPVPEPNIVFLFMSGIFFLFRQVKNRLIK